MTAGKGAGFMAYDSTRRRRTRRCYRPRPVNDCVAKPAADLLTSLGTVALKSGALQLAGYDRATIGEALKPDVNDLMAKTLVAFVTALFCG